MIDSRSTTASEQSAPEYKKERIKWLAEELAVSQDLRGLWLWTQSGQAEGFYRQLGYREFARFAIFPSVIRELVIEQCWADAGMATLGLSHH